MLESSLVQGSAALSEACKQRHTDLQLAIGKANERWRAFEERLYGLENELLEGQLRQHFGLQQCDVEDWTESGRRRVWRLRIHARLLEPLEKQMAEAVAFVPSTEESGDTRTVSSAIEDLTAQSERVYATIEAAVAADKKLDGKIRRTEREEKAKGIMSLGMQDTKSIASLFPPPPK